MAQPADREDRRRRQPKSCLSQPNENPISRGGSSAVIDAYKAQFHQQSVGIITRDSCAAF